MPERSEDLEMYRERFLNQLHESQPELNGHQEFLRYWKLVESEAKQTEELGKLEDWVKNLARDKDRVRALRQKLEAHKDGETASASRAMLHIILQILMLLEDIEQKLKKRRDKRRRVLGWLVFRAGPGVKMRQTEEEQKGDQKKEDDKIDETVLAKPKPEEEKKPKKQLSR